MNTRPELALYDRRVPPSVLVPQFIGPALLAGTPYAARIALILAVGANVPIALAGRLEPSGPPSLVRALPGWLIEWKRSIAAWLYALALLGLAALVDPSYTRAVVVAAGASGVAGALMYVLPGDSTPSGMRLRLLPKTGAPARGERIVFLVRRLGHVLALAVAPLLVVDVVLSVTTLVAAIGCWLTSHTVRRIADDRSRARTVATAVAETTTVVEAASVAEEPTVIRKEPETQESPAVRATEPSY